MMDKWRQLTLLPLAHMMEKLIVLIRCLTHTHDYIFLFLLKQQHRIVDLRFLPVQPEDLRAELDPLPIPVLHPDEAPTKEQRNDKAERLIVPQIPELVFRLDEAADLTVDHAVKLRDQ